jgi:hypothetical protein
LKLIDIEISRLPTTTYKTEEGGTRLYMIRISPKYYNYKLLNKNILNEWKDYNNCGGNWMWQNHENDIFVRPIKSLSTTVRAASMELEVYPFIRWWMIFHPSILLFLKIIYITFQKYKIHK